MRSFYARRRAPASQAPAKPHDGERRQADHGHERPGGTAASQDKAAELQDFAKQSIAPYKYPRVVEFVAELPKTISGKTQRYRLRQLAEENLRSSPR